MQDQSNEGRVCQTIKHWLDTFLDTLDYKTTNILAARLVHAADPKEIYCHVQFNSLYTGAPLSDPVIWWKKDWDLNYKNFCLKKEQQALERLRNNIRTENITRGMKILMFTYHISEETSRDMMIECLNLKQYEFLRSLKIHIEE